MDISRLPEPLRRRAEEMAARPPEEQVRNFLGAHLADAVSLGEVRVDLMQTAEYTTRGLRRYLAAFEALLAAPQPPGSYIELVAYDANWVVEPVTDESSEAFLRQIADILRHVIDEAEHKTGDDRLR